MTNLLSRLWSLLVSLRRSDEQYLEDVEAAERAEDSQPFAREDRSTGLWNEGPGGTPGSG